MTDLRLRTAATTSILVLILALAAMVGGTSPASAADTCQTIGGETLSFSFTGSVQTVQVPDGVVKARVEVRGGHGGGTDGTADGGHGGLIETVLPVSPGQCVSVYVGSYGGSDRWGFGDGGDRGTQFGLGKDGSGGGGGSAIAIDGQDMVIAGGGGGGGGNGAAFFVGGSGGDGAGGTGPNTLAGSEGGNGTGVPATYFVDLGGMGGAESGNDGQSGEDNTYNLASGAGGGGGGGKNGGGGGGNWNGTQQNNFEKPVGGGGGGGGDSWLSDQANDSQVLVDDGYCPIDGGSDLCNGSVTIDWAEQPTKVLPYAGGDQTAQITTGFSSALEAKILATSGDPVPGAEVTFRLPAGGAGASFNIPGNPATATATSDSRGIARSPDFTANSTAGPWNARAAVTGVTARASFAMANEQADTAAAAYSSPEPSTTGEPVTFTAVVGAAPSSAGVPTGNVDFEVDGSQIGPPVPLNAGGIAIAAPVVLNSGKQQVTASFEGSRDFKSSSTSISHQVLPGATQVTVATSPDPSSEGQPVHLIADVIARAPATGDPTGRVQFSVDGTMAGPPVPMAGDTAETDVTVADPGQHVVRASYGGDSAFSAGQGVTVQSVGDEATATTLTSSDASPVFGSPLTLTAAVTGPVPATGDVTFSASGNGLGEFEICDQVTLVGGQAQCEVDPTLATGDYELIAEFEPDSLGVDPSEDRLSQSVREASLNLDVAADPNPVRFGGGYGLDATASPVPFAAGQLSGRVAFSVDNAHVGDPVDLDQGNASLPPGATSPLEFGVHAIGATYAGDRDFRNASAATVLTVDAVDTETRLQPAVNHAPFGRPVKFTADVSAVETVPGPVAGTVQFWADGKDHGRPVKLNNGIASTSMSDLGAGNHDVRAYFKSSGGDFLPSEARANQAVDSPPPRPDGILPCADRRVVLTAAYRLHNSVRFEGVARYALRGLRVNIRLGKRVISEATVRPDGTFWAGARDPRGDIPANTRFRAVISGYKSWPRRLSQAIVIRKRMPWGTKRRGTPRIAVAVTAGGRHKLTLSRQTGCRKKNVKTVKSLVTSPTGAGNVGMDRPGKGQPYVIYRVRTNDGKAVSPPIIVRSAK